MIPSDQDLDREGVAYFQCQDKAFIRGFLIRVSAILELLEIETNGTELL